MAATILNSPRAVEMSVYVVRAFVKPREVLASHAELARKLEIVEKSLANLDAGTRRQLLLDSDLALLYGVSARRLNEQVRRNADRFPEGFIFTLTNHEVTNLKSQNATSSWGGKRKSPLAFSEHGAIMAATVLNSPRAVQMTIYIVRAFVKTRELLTSHSELAQKLELLERSLATLDVNTRRQFEEVYGAILALMEPATMPQ
jgi:hypothetical protein